MDEAASDSVNIAIIASAACGSVVLIAIIIVAVCVIGYCYDRLRRAPDIRSRRGESNQPLHHNRRQRRRRGLEEGEGAHPRGEDVHLEDSELQPHPPPPSYSRVHQYSSVEVGLDATTQQDHDAGEQNGTTRASMYIGDNEEETVHDQEPVVTNDSEINNITQVGPPQQDTLPPTYSTAQLELMAANRRTEEEGNGINGSLAREESQLTSPMEQSRSAGSLPPSYSTARMELMRVQAQNSMEQGLPEEDDGH
jgi:hypothetical protein